MRRELRGYAIQALSLFVVLEVLLVLAVVWWPNFEESLGSLRKLAKLEMFAKQIDLIDMYGVAAYVVGQQFFKACNTLGAAAAVLFAMNAIAGEAQRGTLEIWLARPVSRTRLFTERYLLGQAAVFLPVLATSMTIPMLLRLVDERMAYGPLVACSVQQGLFLGALYSVTFLLSALSSEPLRIAMVMLFGTVFEFAIYMVKTATHYSLFRLVDIEAHLHVLNTGSVEPKVAFGLLAANGIAFAAGLAAMKRRVP